MVLSKQFFSAMGCAALLAIGSLGLSAVEAQAKSGNGNAPAKTGGGSGGGNGGNGSGGQSIGTCSLTDVSLFSSAIGATQCENATGNDSVNNFSAFGQSWNFFGKYDVDEKASDKVSVTASGDKDIKTGTWLTDQDLEQLADKIVVVLKAGNFYSSYLFDNLSSYNQAVNSGQFTVNGVTAGGKAALSHVTIYYTPRLKEEKPPTIPEPTAALAFLAVVGAGLKLKEQSKA
jgi:hypothetical protein